MKNIIRKDQFLKLIEESFQTQDMDEMAREPKYPKEQGYEHIRINKSDLWTKSRRRGGGIDPNGVPILVTQDPYAPEWIPETIQSDDVCRVKDDNNPEAEGHLFLRFRDYGITNTQNQQPGAYVYIDLEPNEYGKYELFYDKPRAVKYGTEWDREQANRRPNEEAATRDALKMLREVFEGNSQVTHKLTANMIPPIIARPEYIAIKQTHIAVKKEKEFGGGDYDAESEYGTFSFGGKRSEIKFELSGKYLFKDIYSAFEELAANRLKIDEGISTNYGLVHKEPRKQVSKGTWAREQSIYSEEAFKNAGKLTPILLLLKKNINRGLRQFLISSVLKVKGWASIVDDGTGDQNTTYTMMCNFESGWSHNVDSNSNIISGDLMQPIQFTIIKNYPGKLNGYDSKFFNSVYNEMGRKLMENILAIDNDDVLGKFIDLINPEETPEAARHESVKPKIALTESQIKMVMEKTQKKPIKAKIVITEQQLQNVIKNTNNPAQETDMDKEESYDDAFTKYQEMSNREISMPADAAEMLLNFGKDWCQGKPTHPDCMEIDNLRTKLKM
jgi:hypothetical protein